MVKVSRSYQSSQHCECEYWIVIFCLNWTFLSIMGFDIVILDLLSLRWEAVKWTNLIVQLYLLSLNKFITEDVGFISHNPQMFYY